MGSLTSRTHYTALCLSNHLMNFPPSTLQASKSCQTSGATKSSADLGFSSVLGSQSQHRARLLQDRKGAGRGTKSFQEPSGPVLIHVESDGASLIWLRIGQFKRK